MLTPPIAPAALPSHPPAGRACRHLRLLALILAGLVLALGGAMAPVASAHRHHRRHHASPRVLKMGMRGHLVRVVQHALHVRADGVFGRGTRRAVRRFQRRNHLDVDGVVGAQTMRALGLSRQAERMSPGSPSKSSNTTSSSDASSGSGTSAALQAIAQCESGGDPTAVSPDGRYRGKYQFTRATWHRMGGKGDPARASEATQDRLAAKLYAQEGGSPWPSCSRQAGIARVRSHGAARRWRAGPPLRGHRRR